MFTVHNCFDFQFYTLLDVTQIEMFTLFSAHDLLLPAGGKGLVKTDLAISVPPGYYGRVGESVSE